MKPWIPLALLTVGCGSSPSPTHHTPSNPEPVVKAIEPEPPTNIGDGSPIVFTHWKGVRRASGSFAYNGQKLEVDAFEMELNPDRTAILEIGGKELKGTWAKRDGKTVDIVLGSGKGEVVFMDRANPTSLKYDGEDTAENSVKIDLRVQE